MCHKLVGAEVFKVKHIRKNGAVAFIPKYTLPHPSVTPRYDAEGERVYTPNWRRAAKCNLEFIDAVVEAVEKVQVRYSQVMNRFLRQLLILGCLQAEVVSGCSRAHISNVAMTYFRSLSRSYRIQVQAAGVGGKENIPVKQLSHSLRDAKSRVSTVLESTHRSPKSPTL